MPLPWHVVARWSCLAVALANADALSSHHECQRLRVPRASVVHELVHLASFDNVPEQAERFVVDWQLPAYKTPEVTRQLLDALEEMAEHSTSEALVNVTRDYTLSYQVSVAARGAGVSFVDEMLVIAPERPFNETLRAFCERFEVDACEELHEKLFPLAVRDWGCHEEDEPEADIAVRETTEALPSAPTKPQVEAPMLEPTQDVNASVHEAAQLPLPVLTVQVDNTSHNVTLRADEDLELQAALLCRQWQTPASDCAKVLHAMRALTRGHAAFESKPPRHTARSPSGLVLQLSSPAVARLNAISERVYFDGEWLDAASQRVEGRRTVCLYYYNIDREQPQICGPFPPEEMWFISRDSLPEGHHIALFAEPPDGITTTSITFLAARFFSIVTPSVKVLDIRLRTVESTVLVVLTIETMAFDLFDPEYRVCALVDDDLECFQPHRLHVELQSGTPEQRLTVFRAALFGVRPGTRAATILLLNSYNSAFAHSDVVRFTVSMDPTMALAPRDPSYFFEPASARHVQRPATCPPPLKSSGLGWICDLWRHEWGRYSQNGEDGVLQSIFHHIGTSNKFYVEFGTEDARECNTRYLREMHEWQGLLLDGRYANASINLHQAWISPENINELFTTYDVPREFDLLSVDVDFNDYWILDAIDRTRFSPRVVAIEINSHVPPHEPRVVKYNGPTARWDGRTAFFGVGVGAMHVWGARNGYSLVYCESHGVNCFLVRDDVLASVTSDEDATVVVRDVLRAADLHAPPNFFGRNASYPWPTSDSGIVEEWVWLEEP